MNNESKKLKGNLTPPKARLQQLIMKLYSKIYEPQKIEINYFNILPIPHNQQN
jgi:hypothetical protein